MTAHHRTKAQRKAEARRIRTIGMVDALKTLMAEMGQKWGAIDNMGTREECNAFRDEVASVERARLAGDEVKAGSLAAIAIVTLKRMDAKATIWSDRDGKARPTPERRAKGCFVLRDTEDAGATVAVDEEASMIGRLQRAGIITATQAHAATDLAALLERTRITSRGRSCLDTTPIGHEGDAEPTHGELRDAQERAEIYLSCGVAIWRELLRLCQDDDRPRNIGLLRQGLDICVRYWRLQ